MSREKNDGQGKNDLDTTQNLRRVKGHILSIRDILMLGTCKVSELEETTPLKCLKDVQSETRITISKSENTKRLESLCTKSEEPNSSVYLKEQSHEYGITSPGSSFTSKDEFLSNVSGNSNNSVAETSSNRNKDDLADGNTFDSKNSHISNILKLKKSSWSTEQNDHNTLSDCSWPGPYLIDSEFRDGEEEDSNVNHERSTIPESQNAQIWQHLYKARLSWALNLGYTASGVFPLPSLPYLGLATNYDSQTKQNPIEEVREKNTSTNCLTEKKPDLCKDEIVRKIKLLPSLHIKDDEFSSKDKNNGSNEPSETTAAPRRRRQRQAYSVKQLSTLEKEFRVNRYLCSEKREELARNLELSENQVKAWFQNRRTKHKKQLMLQQQSQYFASQTSRQDDLVARAPSDNSIPGASSSAVLNVPSALFQEPPISPDLPMMAGSAANNRPNTAANPLLQQHGVHAAASPYINILHKFIRL